LSKYNNFNSKYTDTKEKFIFQFAQNTRNSAQYEKDNITIIFEGILLDFKLTDHAKAKNLHQKYLKQGEHFVKNLRGSFQIVVIDKRKYKCKICIYSDHTASRQMFYSRLEGSLLISPDIEPIATRLPTKTIDNMAMANFMISGHFPAGHTAIKEINVLGPGEYLLVERGTIKKEIFYQFKIEPDNNLKYQEAARELDTVLKERIIDHWRNAKNPAILLSGGYDSQYIFYTICSAVEDTSKLITVTWGQSPEKQYADMDIARRTAKRFCTKHIEIEKITNSWRLEYEEMFKAQNGMTASSFFHANELYICKRLNQKYGIKSILRGDECLGYGPDSNTAQEALRTNSMSYPEYIKGIFDWFKDSDNNIDEYSKFMDRLVAQYKCNSYNSLKDTLDFYERQHMNRNPLNYYKLHYLDVYCPLIDPDVLDIFSILPVRFRRNKQLFKRVINKKFGNRLMIAEYTNLTDWNKVISESDEIKQFFIREFKNLPDFFDYEYFCNITALIKKVQNNRIKKKVKNCIYPLKKILPIESIRHALVHRGTNSKQYISVPLHMLVIRAAVLARWNRFWIN
jgi:asparagine synthetase B (glutamine-hydrolysing)